MDLSNLPYEILYDITIMSPQKENEIIEGWSKIDYKPDTYNIIKSKFSHDASHIPGLEQVFETMALDMAKKTPLQHLISRTIIDD